MMNRYKPTLFGKLPPTIPFSYLPFHSSFHTTNPSLNLCTSSALNPSTPVKYPSAPPYFSRIASNVATIFSALALNILCTAASSLLPFGPSNAPVASKPGASFSRKPASPGSDSAYSAAMAWVGRLRSDRRRAMGGGAG